MAGMFGSGLVFMGWVWFVRIGAMARLLLVLVGTMGRWCLRCLVTI